ncbi:TIR domain-containing protein [Candidatus Thiodiazotropha sp. CDECU1]|uniref:TIR domain-containing protein n=1 Tax=Candidatus Thiodiazotropha sp. CDECU1 TaxID=3065865 RepID=UPI00292D02BF|nr:TIR domain-containing protein [Candidatus Thiodiazotropha sp. CDECU1]
MPESIGVFLSWSGEKSKQLAKVFDGWLPSVIQRIETYYSPEDISKGTRWNDSVASNLERSSTGIIFITSTNTTAPWIMFEAGALSKKVGASRVCPLLFEIEPTDLRGPLSQFQGANFSKEDIWQLISDLNEELDEESLPHDVLRKLFEKWWPDLEADVVKALKIEEQDEIDVRSDRELIKEVLTLVRTSTFQSYVRGVGPDQKAVEDLVFAFANLIRTASKLRNDGLINEVVKIDPPLARLLVQCRYGRSQFEEMRREMDEVTKTIDADTARIWSKATQNGSMLLGDEIFGIDLEHKNV